MEAGRPVLGVVHGPALRLTYKAAKLASSSTCNNAPIRIGSSHTELALIDNYPEPRARRAYDALGFERYIESGSIALKICRVAEWDSETSSSRTCQYGTGTLPRRTCCSNARVAYWRRLMDRRSPTPDRLKSMVCWPHRRNA